ncbi:MAG: tRNA (N6-threonylcarbamoyladenosine(37)-N6)-methyltransferase TrmO [Patescibacteria group bacterium]
MEITLKTIGFARNQETDHFGGWGKVVTDLVIKDEYRDALTGLEDYSHVFVIYWMHNVKTCDIRHVPQGKVGAVPEVGIFACRCPQRPNPIGLSLAKIVSIKGNLVTVQSLDVIKNTPILDLKPYTPQYDSAVDVKIPEWVNKLEY